MPIKDGGIEYNLNEFKDHIQEINGNDSQKALEDELNSNKDTSAIFYELDLSKLDLTRVGDNFATYFIASDSLHVYSDKALTAKGNKYFSISSKINANVALRENELNSSLASTCCFLRYRPSWWRSSR